NDHLEVIGKLGFRRNDSHLNTDHPQLLDCHGKALLHYGVYRLSAVLDVPFGELLNPGTGSRQFPRDDDLASQSAGFHNSPYNTRPGLSEIPTAFQSVSQALGHDLGIETGVWHLLNLDLRGLNTEI